MPLLLNLHHHKCRHPHRHNKYFQRLRLYCHRNYHRYRYKLQLHPDLQHHLHHYNLLHQIHILQELNKPLLLNLHHHKCRRPYLRNKYFERLRRCYHRNYHQFRYKFQLHQDLLHHLHHYNLLHLKRILQERHHMY